MTQIVRLPHALALTGHSRSAFYKRIQMGLLPKPFSISCRSVGWQLTEIEAVNRAVIQGKSDHELRALVSALESARKGS